jgi:adenine/guanine/hypoxanthine permease
MGEFSWWRKGDLDGFFGLFVDNLIQLILIVTLCGAVLGFPPEMVYGRILPGVAVSLLVGNIYYAFQARALMRRTGQSSAAALPFGVNTVSLFGFILFVMLPVVRQTQDTELAWRVGLAACFGSGLIELGGAFVAGWVKKVTPRAALLATLAGIAITFISMDFCFRIFKDPLVGLAPMAIIFLQYIGRLKLPKGVPAGFVAVIVGTALAWGLGRMDYAKLLSSFDIQLRLPTPFVGELAQATFSEYMVAFLPVIIPMGLFNLIGSLQNLESAEAAGDTYPVKSSLVVNGVGTIAAACFGSCFPTTIYIGHPGWKSMGAGAGYSVANGLVITLLCCLGLVGFVSALIPVEAGAAILLWIGIIIAAQAFQATPREHAPAVVVGFFPALAAWGLMMLEDGIRSTGSSIGIVGVEAIGRQLPVQGMIALERGFIFTSMIFAAITVALVEGRFKAAAIWAFVAAAISATGLMHGYTVDVSAGILNDYGPETTWPFVVGYSVMGLLFIYFGVFRDGRDRLEGH